MYVKKVIKHEFQKYLEIDDLLRLITTEQKRYQREDRYFNRTK